MSHTLEGEEIGIIEIKTRILSGTLLYSKITFQRVQTICIRNTQVYFVIHVAYDWRNVYQKYNYTS